MKTLSALLAVVLLAFIQPACNPECVSLDNVRLSSDANPNGFEILITANPLDGLKNKKVLFGAVEAESAFHENLGLIVKIPEGVSGDVELKIEDPDCLDFIRVPFKVAGQSYFENNLNYVPPTPPVIVLPTIDINPPPFIDNAWLSPENPEYCLWFQMVVDSATGQPTKYLNPSKSVEQALCPCLRTSDLPFARNRMFGIVDKEKNYIEITVDRTPIGGDYEKFSGRFINMAQVEHYAADLDTAINCYNQCPFDGTSGPLGYMMLLTSQKTGRQLTVYQKRP